MLSLRTWTFMTCRIHMPEFTRYIQKTIRQKKVYIAAFEMKFSKPLTEYEETQRVLFRLKGYCRTIFRLSPHPMLAIKYMVINHRYTYA